MPDLLLVMFFLAGYVAITMEHSISVNKAAVALLMGVLSWIVLFIHQFPYEHTVVLSLNEHLADIAQLLFFLLGAMTIVELINSHNGFTIVTRLIKTHSKGTLLWTISFVTFCLSSVLDNLTTSIIMITLLHQLIGDKDDRMIFGSMIIIAANAGGAWTPIGDVTTTMLWISGRVTSGKIMLLLLIPSLVSLAIPLLHFSRSVKGTLNTNLGHNAEVKTEHGAGEILSLGIGALIFVPVLKSATGLPPYMGIILGLGLMWIFTDLIHQEQHYLRVPHVLARIDISSILFFFGILLSIAALEQAGLLKDAAAWMETHLGDKDVIVATLGLLSSVIDNVPLTAAAMHMYSLNAYPADSKLWEMIAYCVGTGGSILIIGSAAGVLVMGMERISFFWYLRKISLPALIGYLAGMTAFLFIFNFLR